MVKQFGIRGEIMMIDPNCGYFNEERDDEYAPPYGECEECYGYNICRRAQILEELLSGNMVNISLGELHYLIAYFPDKINTLMIQKSSDGYCIVVDEVSVCRNIENEIKIEFQGE
jgi:hypothetical protein